MLESRPLSGLGRTSEPAGQTASSTFTASELTQASPDAGRPLADLVRSLGERTFLGDAAVLVTAVTYRSDEVGPGSLYFCVPGTRVDGHDFALDAVRTGAVALVVERRQGLDVPQVVVPSVRRAMGPGSAEVYGRPS